MARDRQRAKQRKARRAAQNPGPARAEPHRANVPGELEHASGRGGRVRGRADRRARAHEDDEARHEDDEPTAGRAEADPDGDGETTSELDGSTRRARRDRRGEAATTEEPAARPSPPRRRAAAATAPADRARRRSAARPLHRLPARVVGRAPARAVAGPPSGRPGHRRRARLRDHRRPVPRPRRPRRPEDRRLHHLAAPRQARNPCIAGTSSTPTPGTRTRSSRTSSTARLAEPAARRAPGRRPDRDRVEMKDEPEGVRGEAHDARLRAREHGAQRRLLAARQGHARASPASSARPTSPCR